jgi:hypothetical protein
MPNLFTQFAEVIHTVTALVTLATALCATATAFVAAISSLRNGRKIDRHDDATKMKANHRDNGAAGK